MKTSCNNLLVKQGNDTIAYDSHTNHDGNIVTSKTYKPNKAATMPKETHKPIGS